MRFFANEREFQRWVLGEARARGWKATHLGAFDVVRSAVGVRAIPLADAKGFPDCVFAHPVHGLAFAELKMPRGSSARRRELTEEQTAWVIALRATGASVYVWHPFDQDEVLEVLDGKVPSGRLFTQEVAT